MRSTDLTKAQAHQIHTKLQPGLNYLARLRKRMQQRGFDPTDSLMADVIKAHQSAQDLAGYLPAQEGGPRWQPRSASSLCAS